MAELIVDAIVVNYNTKDLLRACLASLEASAYPIRRIYCVDNASVDGSPEMVRAEFPGVELLAMTENLGFARGNNAAYERSDAPAILLLNSDAEIGRDTLGEMVRELESDPEIGIVGPVLVGNDGRVQYEGGRRDPSILGEFGNITKLNVRRPDGVFGRYMMNDWDHRSTRDVEVLSGACMLIRREALGGQLFRDDFFMYGEDIELSQRVRENGYKNRYLGSAEVLHHGGAASKKARTKMRVAGVVSMWQLLGRTRGWLYALGYVAIVPIAWPLGILVNRLWKRS
jgi:GT2 family glycosyltransferase